MKRYALTVCTAVIVVLIAALSIACAQQPNNAGPTQKSETTQTSSWSMDSDCDTCHTAQAEGPSSGKCLASMHLDQGNTCTSCHTDESGLQKVHEMADASKMPDKLKKTKVTSETCLSCHGSLEELAAKTAASGVVLTDSAGKQVNPHALPPSQDHDALQCSDCHISHEDVNTLENAEGVCASCHHTGVYECGTCHE